MICKISVNKYIITYYIIFNVKYDEGGRVILERSDDGKIQVEIGILLFYTAKENKTLDSEESILEEKKNLLN